MSVPYSRPSVTFKIGDQPVPGYRIVRELGRGTFGVVWLTVTENGFERALKVVNLEQKGGKKEFRALRLIKDRKILHGNLLTLIDYWLLDRDGTILSSASAAHVENQLAPVKSRANNANTAVEDGISPKVSVTNLSPASAGTMMPGEALAEPALNIRDTFQSERMTDTTEEENSQAIWLIVAMELGHKTLHDRQKEHTAELQASRLTSVKRKEVTQFDGKDDTAAGSHTVADRRKPVPAQHDDDDLSALPADEILPYMEQAARGLDYLHRCDIVHRDVKPQNIMLVGDVAKVCDYGLASELGDIRATTNAFTLPYAASEAINKNEFSPYSDQYSLAVTYVELRTGRWPFISNTSTAVYAAKDTGVHHLRFIRNRNVRAVLKKALSKKPQERYSTCGEFVKQLSKAEATKFNLFATAQAFLAILAIVTVLLAAAATHPEVWKRIQPAVLWLADAAGIKVPPPPPPSITAPEFRARLVEAEKRLHNDEDLTLAVSDFRNLHSQVPHISGLDEQDRVSAYLGLARALAGHAERLYDPDLREIVKSLLDNLAGATALTDKQRIQSDYLHLVVLGDVSTPSLSPEDVEGALTNWELELWRIRINVPPKTPLDDLIAQIVAHRHSKNFSAARAGLTELRTKLQTEPDADRLIDHVELEDLHLSFSESSDDPAHLQKLDEFLRVKIAAEKQLLDRARLLRLLVVNKAQPSPATFLTPMVIPALVELGLEPFPEARTLQSTYRFAPDEAASLLSLKTQITDEFVQSPVVTTPAALSVFVRLYKKDDAAKHLCDRLEYLLKQPLTAEQLVVIQNAAANLQTFVEQQKPWETLSTAKRVPLERKDADLRLQVALLSDAPASEAGISGLVELVARSSNPGKGVQQLIDKAGQPGWTKVVGPAVRDLLVHSTLKTTNSQDLAKWRSQLESLSLHETWLTDPRDAATIATIKSTVTDSIGADRGPLATLILLECELPLPGSPAADLRPGLQSDIEEVQADAATEPLLAAYREFLLARARAAASNSIDHSEAALAVVELLSTEQLPSWLTATRREALKEVLTVAAWDKLNLTDQDLLRFVDLSLETDSQLVDEMKAVDQARLQVPALPAVAAVIEAIQGAKGAEVSWETIRDRVAALRADSISVAIFDRAGSAQLLRYVEALAAIKSTPAGSDLKAEVVQSYHQVLFARQDDSPLFFRFMENATTQDEGVLRNLVNPLLIEQGSRQDVAGKKPAYAKELASIWAVKGRLLQRSPHIVHFEPAATAELDAKKAATLALSLANAAFETALTLDYHDEYLVGFGRTLAGMPAEIKSYSRQRKELNELVRQHNPDGKSTHAGMQFLFAYVRKAEGYSNDNVKTIQDATTRYNEVRNRLAQDDPYDLVPIVCEGLSDLHLRQAFLTMHSKTTTAEVRALLAGQKVPESSKAYHLGLAVEYAQEALTKADSNSRDNAYMCLGNAYEDFAFYLGVTKEYSTSHTHFDKSINESNSRNRSAAKAKMNYGRSQFRYADDSLSTLATPLDRIRIFGKAIDNLEAARDSGELLDSSQVECEFWLAKSHQGKAKLQSEADSLASFKAALEHTRKAGSLAQQFKMPQSFYYESLKLEVEIFRAMAGGQKDLAKRRELFAQMRPAIDTAYALFADDPQGSNAIIINALATHSREAWPNDPTNPTNASNAAKRIRWTTGSSSISAQWNHSDGWKYQAVTLNLINSDLTSSRTVAIQKAREIAANIEDARIKQEALARISDFEALVAFDAWEKSKGNASEATRPAVQTEAKNVLKKLLAAWQAHQDNLDADATDLLNRINKVAAVNPGDISSYEKKKLQTILRSPDVGFRLNLLTVYLYVNSFDTQVTTDLEQVRTMRDCLNPLIAFKDSEFQGVANVQYKQRAQTALVLLNGLLNPGKSAASKSPATKAAPSPPPKNSKQAAPTTKPAN